GYKGFLRKRKISALTDLNLEVRRGEVFGLLGLNAAGKSTVLKILLGLTFPSAGEFKLLEKNGITPSVKQRVGFLPENPSLYRYLSAWEFLDLCARLFKLRGKEKKKRIEELLDLVELRDVKRVRIGEFSKGMIQRLGIASSLVNNPELIFLDEPMSGLDFLGRKKIKNIILKLKREGKTIIFSSHILSEVEEICDRIGILHKGRLICLKDIDELKKEGISLEELFLQQIESRT
ncbi:ABC transporter ATP-binding protein, partial [Candidatus Aerophobetes bacterium]|nr:ABC transporter ATP-binding protein [Candidatus Aerophobetes bacterium]